ncbi:MAG: carbohydrate ABC transporter permease [Paracholeplasma sp.]|jgi:multiple sugar transport system permease protein|uniref:ABC transporter, permease protein n=1 Tax=Acholeplasma brassicae TaxID=61635 RepID=U4KRK4_9MOLU|nr:MULTISPECIES: carbohydrate ABC transporter permease [Paracholeplasma]MDY3195453.1 carbohydrate ABC transporter permease [Paracholeplasma sp.]CCV65823.1 ABC transporter, permease protein [Paracholeplasma brassicae]
MELNKSLFSIQKKQKAKKVLFGMHTTDGLIYRFVLITLLISFSYIYLYPVLFMLVNSLKSVDDLLNPGVRWVPTTLEFNNYQTAFKVLDMPSIVFSSTWYVLKVSLITTISSALIGYGFAMYEFPFKKLFLFLMLATFILPPQVLMVSNMTVFRLLGIISSSKTMTLPALFGQGLNQSIFILIYYQFFKTIPQVLMESAEIDGASQLKIFFKIALPSAIPSIVIVFLFSFVWYWNETFMTALYVGGQVTLPLKLQAFVDSYSTLFQEGTIGARLNEAIKLAGTMLTVLPLLVLYFFAQKNFTESIDRTGITGE